VTLSIATITVKLPQSNWYIRREELKKRSRSQRRSRHKTKFSSTQFGSGTIHPTPTRFPSTMDTLSTGTPAYMALYPTQSTDGGTWDTRTHTYVYCRGRGGLLAGGPHPDTALHTGVPSSPTSRVAWQQCHHVAITRARSIEPFPL
jgi:hypothetical protein